MIRMASSHWDTQRQQMVDEQLRARGIQDLRVLEAMRDVPRHLFVLEAQRHRSYEDRALSIGHEQTISQPYIVGAMLQSLELTGQEKVLEIGTGSGYQAALLAHLARQVDTIEMVPELITYAKTSLACLGLSRVRIHQTDGSQGLAKEAPYDRIIVAAAAPDVPPPLIDQLAPEGKLLIPLGDRKTQMLTLLTKQGSEIMRQTLGVCAFVPLRGMYGWPAL
jgi:protein-L-isoaspartate(D-aspartate) O-methyltransferase